MPNHAAFKRDDIDDARRGHPISDLAAYGAERGLEPIGSRLVGHLAGLNPRWENYVFNVLRGEVVTGRFGTIQHELHEEGLADDADPEHPGPWRCLHARRKMSLRSFLPFGELFEREPPNEPFAAQAFWVPATGIKLLVPEATLLPSFAVRSSAFYPVIGAHRVAPGYALQQDASGSKEVRDAICAAIGPLLASLDTTFAELRWTRGQLGLRVDGFRDDPADLDALVLLTGRIADALCWLVSPELDPVDPELPFEAPLPGFDASTHPPGYVSFESRFDRSGMLALEQDAARLGLRVEDPAALHRRFRHLPVPGASRGVLAGQLPGTSAFGRLTWNHQTHPGGASLLRRAVIVAARPGTATPPGGIKLDAGDCWVAVSDGLACAWPRVLSGGRLETDELVERGLAALRDAGVADV